MISLFFQLVLDGMGMGLVYVILAAGLVLILSVSKIFFVAYGQFYMIGAYVMWAALVLLKLPFIVGLMLAVAATTILGLLSYRFIFQGLQYIERQFLAMIVAAMGLMMILGQAGLIAFGTVVRGVPTVLSGVVRVAGVSIALDKLLLIVFGLVVTAVLFVIYEKTRIGRAMRAVAFRPDTASLQGVNTDRIYLVTLGISSALAGFAGGIMAPVYVVHPEMGQNIFLPVLLVVMLGGQGSLVGAVFGGLLLGLTLSFGGYYMGGLAQILLFLIIGVVIFFRPTGLLGKAGAGVGI
jgi:branched-chain amino acid transport system permease protein